MRTIASPLPLLTALPDPRKSTRISLPWADLWLVVLIALLSAPKNILELVHWVHDHAELFEHHFGLSRLPSQASVYRFFALVEPRDIEQVLSAWVSALVGCAPEFEVASVDGKFIKGSGRTRLGAAPFLTCGVYLHQRGVPLACTFAQDGNEVASAKRALPALRALGVSLLVADAGYTGHRFASAVRAHDLDYLLPLKNNQQDALEWARLACSYPCDERADDDTRRGGETWRWTLELTRAVPDEVRRGFVDAAALVKLTRHVALDRGGQRTEVCYAVTSSTRDAGALLRAWRGHWGIENRVHHVRDTVFGEDHCRARVAGPVLAVLRSFVLVIAQHSTVSALRFTRRFAAQPAHSLARLAWLPASCTRS